MTVRISTTFAINGQRDKYSGLMVDGVQNTDMGNQSGLMTYPGMETISEVKILSSNYSAEYGTAGGANMLTVGNANLLMAHGTETQRKVFALNEFNGRFAGTMCLSEPSEAGKLEPQAMR